MTENPVTERPQGSFRQQLNERWDLALAALLLAYFAVRLIFFALWLDPTVPADEIDHFGRVEVFSKATLLPDNTPDSFAYGMVTHRPFLYYVLMAKLLPGNVFPISDLVFLRLINAGLGVLLIVFAWRWIVLITESRLIRTLFLVLVTNTAALTGVAASVSYDNLANLLAVMSIYYMTAFFERRRVNDALALAACLLAGTVTKVAFLPLALILPVVFVIRERKSLSGWPRELIGSLAWRAWPLYAALLLLLAANAGLWGGNILQHGKLLPGTTDVMSLEDALKNRIFARDYIARQYREGALTFEEAVEMTSIIQQRGNRHRALSLLSLARNPGALHASIWSPDVYAGVWRHIMVRRLTGYDGHRVMRKTFQQLSPLYLMFAVAAIAFIRKWRPGDAKGYLGHAALIALSYAMILMWRVGYARYQVSGAPDLGVQGRYLLPVWILICGLLAVYLLQYLPRRAQILAASGVAFYFLWGDFPYFLLNATPCWFMGTAAWPECAATLQ